MSEFLFCHFPVDEMNLFVYERVIIPECRCEDLSNVIVTLIGSYHPFSRYLP